MHFYLFIYFCKMYSLSAKQQLELTTYCARISKSCPQFKAKHLSSKPLKNLACRDMRPSIPRHRCIQKNLTTVTHLKKKKTHS